MSSTSSTPPIPAADVQHFPAIPSYVVALSVVAAVVVTAMLIFILYSCLVQRSKKRRGTTVEQQSPIRETEQLREEIALELDVSLTDSAAVVSGHVKPKPSPSIFSRGDFLMEVLEGVENTTDLSIDGDVENPSHICEDDRVTVAMGDQETDDNHSATPILCTPPSQSATIDLFLENLSTPTATLTSGTLGLRVREDSQADASTQALRGSISSGEGGSGSEGGEVIVCGDIEIYEDPVVGEIHEEPVVGEIHEDPVVGEIHEDPVVGEIHEDPVVGEIHEDPVVGEILEDPVVGEIYEDPVVDEIHEDPLVGEIYEDPVVCLVKEVEVGNKCHEDEIDKLVDDDIKEKNFSNEYKLTATPVEDITSLNLALGFLHKNALTIPKVDLEDEQVEDVEIWSASESVIRDEELFSVEVGDIEHAKDNEEDEQVEYLGTSSPIELSSPSLSMPSNTSPRISGQDASCSNTPLQASTCLAELESTPAQSIPVNVIPVSNQKDLVPNTLSVQLSHSTPTSLLHPLVSMHALPLHLAERALSVSHLSLNRSGKHLPATPLSCNSEYSPVYNMQFGSARRLATDETATEVVVDRGEVEGKECEEEEVDVLSPDMHQK